MLASCYIHRSVAGSPGPARSAPQQQQQQQQQQQCCFIAGAARSAPQQQQQQQQWRQRQHRLRPAQRSRSMLAAASSSAAAGGGFNAAAYDAARLAADAAAMDAMRQKSDAESSMEEAAAAAAAAGPAAGDSGASAPPPGAWKWEIRKMIWDMMEEEDLADFPRPVHHRIPSFKGAAEAADMLARLPEFQAASVVKCNPDTPQKQVRYNVLAGGKTLLTPQPRLRTGFFSTLRKDTLPADALREACTSAGVAKHGTPVSLDDKVKVDLIVVGSVAVDPQTGCRLGKGEGFAELEYGILKWMGAIDEATLVVTTVRDEQVLAPGAIPSARMLPHDVPVDVICTPTQIIRVPSGGPKPPGILWERLSPQKLAQIRILQQLKQRIEKETGAPLPTGPDEVLPPLASRGRRGGAKDGGGAKGSGRGGGGRGGGRQQRQRRGGGGKE